MKEMVGILKKKLDDHEARISKLEAVLTRPVERGKGAHGKKKISLKEFLKEKKPKGYTQTALAIGFYLEKYECLSSFNAKDLEIGFTDAKETPPKNFNDTANINVNNRHMMGCKTKKDDKKAWVLTRAGEDYVESDFKKEMR